MDRPEVQRHWDWTYFRGLVTEAIPFVTSVLLVSSIAGALAASLATESGGAFSRNSILDWAGVGGGFVALWLLGTTPAGLAVVILITTAIWIYDASQMETPQ